MPFKVYIGEKFSHNHETEIFKSLIIKLKEKYDNSEELIVLIGNYYYNNQEIDATIIKKDAVIVIDFKKYGGVIKFSENGKWFAGNTEVKGGNKLNPFIQLRTNKFALINFFKNNHLEIRETKKVFNDLYISAMIIFHNDIEFSIKSLPVNLRNWFHVTDFKRCVDVLDGISEDNINFTKKEIDNIINILGVTEYFSFDKQEEIYDVNIKTKKTEYELTPTQKSSIVNISGFIENKDEKIFQLTGAAGTGKTYLIKEIINILLEKGKTDFKILAPTGRAASNIREKVVHDIRTIHSLIYERNPDKDVEIINDGESEIKSVDKDEEMNVYELHFDVKVNNDFEETVYIIDECSLLSDSYFKNDIFNFGSNKLLSDLLEYTYITHSKRKIILIGDDKQIQRGAYELSSLNPSYFKEKYGIMPRISELKEVVRFKEDSNILLNSLKIRRCIENEVFNEFNIESDGISIFKVNKENIVDHYKPLDKFNTLIIKYTNKNCNNTNQWVKTRILNKGKTIQEGDLIIFYKNYFFLKSNLSTGYSQYDTIQNGEICLVKEVNMFSEVIQQNVGKGTNKTSTRLEFRDIKVELKNGKTYSLKIFENFLFSDEPTITNEELRALVVLFNQNYFKKHKKYPNPRKMGKREYYNAIQSDEYFNSARVKHAYALTCHKAQGSEWKNAIVDFSDWDGHKEDFYRWAYTAITRASEKLFIINEPIIHPYCVLSIVDTNSPLDFGLNNLLYFKKGENIVHEVNELAVLNAIPEQEIEIKHHIAYLYGIFSKNNISIDKIELNTKGYYIRYFLKNSDNIAVLNFIFDKERNFLKPSIIKKSTNDMDFANKAIGYICNNNYSFDIKKAVETCETDLVKSFITHLFEKTKKRFIKILSIEHLNFKERVFFKKNNDSCIIDFYYINDGFITSTQIIKSTSRDFKEELKTMITEFKNFSIN